MQQPSYDISLVIRAIEFAARKHRMQRRKDSDASPYINHPIALMHVLCIDGGIRDPKILAAAALHDTIEDTETTPNVRIPPMATLVQARGDPSHSGMATRAGVRAPLGEFGHLSVEWFGQVQRSPST